MCRLVGIWSGELTLLEAIASLLKASSLGEESRSLGARRSTDVPYGIVEADADIVCTLRRDVRSTTLDVYARAVRVPINDD